MIFQTTVIALLGLASHAFAQSDTIAIITPLSGSVLDAKAPLNLTWTYTPNGGAQVIQPTDVYTVNLMYLPDGPTSGKIVTTLSHLMVSTLSYNLTLPANTTSGIYAIAMVKDKNYFSSPSFTINGLPGVPAIANPKPAAGSGAPVIPPIAGANSTSNAGSNSTSMSATTGLSSVTTSTINPIVNTPEVESDSVANATSTSSAAGSGSFLLFGSWLLIIPAAAMLYF